MLRWFQKIIAKFSKSSPLPDISDVKTGAENIIDGLEYHYENFRQLGLCIKEKNLLGLFKKYNKIINKMNHEATAYLNRMGQFYYFATSKTVRTKIKKPEKFIPTIIEFLPFRHKQTAHRAIDMHKGENKLWMNQVNELFSNKSSIFMDGHLVFQIMLDDKKDFRHFDLLEEHLKIIKEAKDFLSRI